MSGDIALYVHLPFCGRKCLYCSFISFSGREVDIPGYIDALTKEITFRSGHEKVGTLYFGGGTPSLIPAELYVKLLATIKQVFTVDPAAEISIEANPGTINEDYLKDLRKAGFNRLSLGVQSLNEDELDLLGRIHTVNDAVDAVKLARRVGFTNINLDLIYGLPSQPPEAWRRSLEKAIELEPEHLSLYALTLEEDAPLQRSIDSGALSPIDPDISADEYELAEEVLEKAGFRHYEISNWAKAGMECRHNLVYWNNLPYLGVGVAAHSCLNGHRLANTDDLDRYLADFSDRPHVNPVMDERISPDLALAETVILGLRLSSGIAPEDIQRRYGISLTAKFHDQIDEMTDAGLLEQVDGKIRLTPRGRLLSNQVFWRFLPEAQS
jgi:oxygen-independent coproporphyrinogen III oxidase